MFPKSNPRHGNKNSSILHSTNPKRVVREVDYNPIDGAALALVSSHRESQIKGKLLTDPDSGNRREKIPSAESKFFPIIGCSHCCGEWDNNISALGVKIVFTADFT